MKPLTFSLIDSPEHTVNVQQLNPTHLQNKPLREIHEISLQLGNRKVQIADLFDISGQDHSRIVIENSNSKLNRLGEGMTEGTLDIVGDAGAFVGREMIGGTIRVTGSVGPFLGYSMRGGLVQVNGNAGDFVGAGKPGSKHGMINGHIIVSGNAGNRLGNRMRRGLISVHGDVGVGAGAEMIAGTILLLGKSAELPGLQMRRGTIICANHPVLQTESFYQQNFHSFGLLKLIQEQFDQTTLKINLLDFLSQPKFRYVGDLCFGGMGEILTFRE